MPAEPHITAMMCGSVRPGGVVGTTDDPERRQECLDELDQVMPDLVLFLRRAGVVCAGSSGVDHPAAGVSGLSCGDTDSRYQPQAGFRGRAGTLGWVPGSVVQADERRVLHGSNHRSIVRGA